MFWYGESATCTQKGLFRVVEQECVNLGVPSRSFVQCCVRLRD